MFVVEVGGIERRIDDVASLQEWIDNKLITATTPVWVEAEGRLMEAQDIPGLSLTIAKIPPVTNAVRDDKHIVPSRIPDYLILSILSMICCCMPVGIVSVVYAAQVNSHLRRGDLAEAEIASRTALAWALWSIGLGLVASVIYLAYLPSFRR